MQETERTDTGYEVESRHTIETSIRMGSRKSNKSGGKTKFALVKVGMSGIQLLRLVITVSASRC